MAAPNHYDAVVIGSGFGGTMTALPLARAYKTRGKGEKLLMLERGTWWTTPVGTVQDKEVAAERFLRAKEQPVQFWSSAEHFSGFLDIFTRCVRRASNPDGLYDLTNFGRYLPFKLGLAQNDGVTILRASGVGGGSLVYANVTIRPPDFVLTDSDWPLSWDKPKRDYYYDLARDAIGIGVLWALNDRATKQDPNFKPAVNGPQVNTGLSNIVARTARLDPRWVAKPDPLNAARGLKQIDPAHSMPLGTPPDMDNNLWIDRARVFQATIGLPGPDGTVLSGEFGTVDSSINDINPEPTPFDPKGQPKNYCERQGRCIVGCLPGARHTLNKQLMGAVLGGPPSRIAPQGTPALLDGTMELQALAEVEVIKAGPGGGPPYEIHYLRRQRDNPKRFDRQTVTADRVILAAGCVGTNEIMLRSKKGGLPGLSDMVGYGFSTNGDYLAFLTDTRERVSLVRGPVTTSFAHFNTATGDTAKFHTIEDNGIPRALSSVTGRGVPLFKSLSKGRHTRLFIWWALFLYALERIPAFIMALFTNYKQRSDEFVSEDERTMNMMCIAAMGRAAADGRFRLGGFGETPLRVRRKDGAAFLDDPIYREINSTLDRFAQRLTDVKDNHFINPFVSEVAGALNAKSIGLSHPLGGCRMGTSAADGVCDEFGRVFDKSKEGGSGVYQGLYITDAARIPTALGVNPSLTISALALYSVEHIISELNGQQAATAATPPSGLVKSSGA
jgi:choline dehydrogenase-like flavoprotein